MNERLGVGEDGNDASSQSSLATGTRGIQACLGNPLGRNSFLTDYRGVRGWG